MAVERSEGCDEAELANHVGSLSSFRHEIGCKHVLSGIGVAPVPETVGGTEVGIKPAEGSESYSYAVNTGDACSSATYLVLMIYL